MKNVGNEQKANALVERVERLESRMDAAEAALQEIPRPGHIDELAEMLLAEALKDAGAKIEED